MFAATPSPSTAPDALRPGAPPVGDLVQLGTLALLALAALAIGERHAQLGLAAAAAGGIAALAAATWMLARGTLAGAIALGTLNALLVALHIQLGRGTVEYHFGAFALLATLLVYRDWRPIAAVAGVFALHHVAFDRLQAAGLPVYCTPEPDLGKMALHAAYLVVQAGVEIQIAVRLASFAREADELRALVRRLHGDGQLRLDVDDIPVASALGRSLRQAIQAFAQALGEVDTAAAGIRSTSGELARGNLDLGSRTEQQAGSMQSTTASMQTLTDSVEASAATARQASETAARATQAAGRGGEAVGRVVESMQQIEASSRRIGDITGLIDGIAFRTNILALNAAVEAARAGDHGRGFAVVASEVRALAQRAAAAAREIRQLIDASGGEVTRGTALVGEAGREIESLVGEVRNVGELLQRLAGAATTQAGGIGRVGSALQQLDEGTRSNAALVRQSSAATTSLGQQADRLVEVVGRFRMA